MTDLNLIQHDKMKLFSNYWSPLLRLVFVLLTACLLMGCAVKPKIQYVSWTPNSVSLNTWTKVELENNSTYWFTTQYRTVAEEEFTRITKHEADSIPLRRYGFNLWFDGTFYHITQTK